ncbi:manganese efflux pump MntP family protein [Chloroflexota bacterium]
MINSDFLSIIFIAFGLSADCFAVALSGSVSMRTLSKSQVFRASITFGIFQAVMPVLGWLVGGTVLELISGYDHWAAFALLAFVGGRMIRESFRSEDDRSPDSDITRGFTLLTLAVATSIDALAVGLSFAFLEINIILASSIIGIVAFVVSIIGFLIGKKVGSLVGRRAEILGGVVLIIIGLRILLVHIL